MLFRSSGCGRLIRLQVPRCLPLLRGCDLGLGLGLLGHCRLLGELETVLVGLVLRDRALAEAIEGDLGLGLALLGLSAGVWAATQTGSLALAAWSLFLVQALFGLIPSGLARAAPDLLGGAQSDDTFERAHRGAEAALRRIHST